MKILNRLLEMRRQMMTEALKHFRKIPNRVLRVLRVNTVDDGGGPNAFLENNEQNVKS